MGNMIPGAVPGIAPRPAQGENAPLMQHIKRLRVQLDEGQYPGPQGTLDWDRTRNAGDFKRCVELRSVCCLQARSSLPSSMSSCLQSEACFIKPVTKPVLSSMSHCARSCTSRTSVHPGLRPYLLCMGILTSPGIKVCPEVAGTHSLASPCVRINWVHQSCRPLLSTVQGRQARLNPNEPD